MTMMVAAMMMMMMMMATLTADDDDNDCTQGGPPFLLSQEQEESFGQCKIRLAQGLLYSVVYSRAHCNLPLRTFQEVHTDLLLLKKDIGTYICATISSRQAESIK